MKLMKTPTRDTVTREYYTMTSSVLFFELMDNQPGEYIKPK